MAQEALTIWLLSERGKLFVGKNRISFIPSIAKTVCPNLRVLIVQPLRDEVDLLSLHPLPVKISRLYVRVRLSDLSQQRMEAVGDGGWFRPSHPRSGALPFVS